MSAQAAADLERRRFTVEEYERMGQAGILSEDDRVELLAGEIIQMAPIGPVHAWLVDVLTEVLVLRLGGRAIVRVQNPLRLTRHSEPQPDLAILHRRSSYRLAHPVPEDVLLVIEVADSSLAVDRGVKVPLYARARIAEVWVVDVAAHMVVVHRDPYNGEYRSVRTVRPDEKLTVPFFDEVVVTVADLFGDV